LSTVSAKRPTKPTIWENLQFLHEQNGHTKLVDAEDAIFASWEAYVEYPEPYGLGSPRRW